MLTQNEINTRKIRNLWRQKQCLPTFTKRYPDVASCTITYTRTMDWVEGRKTENAHNVMHLDLQNESSLVTVDCINEDCTKGYYDLSSVISSMVSQHEILKTGKISCDGFLNANQIGNYLCSSELQYEIKIEYKY